MRHDFSEIAQRSKPSAVREMLKFAAAPGVISLAAGNPASECIPVDVIRECSECVLKEQPILLLQYSVTEGLGMVRESIRDFVNRYGQVTSEDDEVTVMTGSTQIMDLVGRTFGDPSDTILVEEPSYVGSLNAFAQYGATLTGVRMEEDGVDLADLEEKMRTLPPKFFYIIPNFQNPSGRTTSLAKRQAIMELARQYDVLVLEDNPYGELRFEGDYIPPLKSFDTDGHVLYAGSFSKILAPGLRLGYLIAPKEISEKITIVKQATDVQTCSWSQLVTDTWLRNYDIEAHLDAVRQVYARKCHLMLDAMDACFSKNVKYTRPTGGMFIWGTLPEEVNMLEFAQRCLDAKVAIVPGNAFLTDPTRESHSFRLNYSGLPDEKIGEAIHIIGGISKEMC